MRDSSEWARVHQEVVKQTYRQWMKPRTKPIFIFHQTSNVKKKYQAWRFSEDWDFSANFSIWMYTWLAWVPNTVPRQHYLGKELSKYFIFDFPQPPVFSQYSNFKSLLSTHTHLQRGYWRGEPKRADSTCIYNYLFLYHSAMSSLCGNLDMPSTCFPDAFN